MVHILLQHDRQLQVRRLPGDQPLQPPRAVHHCRRGWVGWGEGEGAGAGGVPGFKYRAGGCTALPCDAAHVGCTAVGTAVRYEASAWARAVGVCGETQGGANMRAGAAAAAHHCHARPAGQHLHACCHEAASYLVCCQRGYATPNQTHPPARATPRARLPTAAWPAGGTAAQPPPAAAKLPQSRCQPAAWCWSARCSGSAAAGGRASQARQAPGQREQSKQRVLRGREASAWGATP